MKTISFADFAKVEMRVGKILEAKKEEQSEKLIRMVVYFGKKMGKKTVFSGIYKWYKPEELVGKKTVFVVNVEPKAVMGELSEAMILGAGTDEISLLWLDKKLASGTKVY